MLIKFGYFPNNYISAKKERKVGVNIFFLHALNPRIQKQYIDRKGEKEL